MKGSSLLEEKINNRYSVQQNKEKKQRYMYEPAKPVDLEHAAQHLGVHAGRKNPVDGRSTVIGLR